MGQYRNVTKFINLAHSTETRVLRDVEGIFFESYKNTGVIVFVSYARSLPTVTHATIFTFITH